MSDLPALPVMLGAITERQFQAQVTGLANLKGWLVHAERPAWTSKGWRTAIMGDPGFPDLVMVKGHRVLLIELKTERGKLTPDQEAWLQAIQAAQSYNLRAYVWRPSDWESIEEVLR